MPCRDTSDEQAAYDLARPRLDYLAQMLCALCRQCESRDAAHWIDEAGAGAWWESHKREDARREALESERQAAEAAQQRIERRAVVSAMRDTVIIFTDDELAAMGLRRIATERMGDARVIV